MDYEIDPAEVKLKLAAGDVALIDVREGWERQTAAIQPSRHIPMGDIPASLPQLDPDDHIVVYCHHGVRSMNVTAWLRQQGFEKVQSMRGGIDRWSKTVDPKIPTY